MSAFKKLPALGGRNNPCLNCQPILPKLSMQGRIAVGFGYAALTRDGESIWEESGSAEYAECMTVRAAEKRAQRNPKHDWRIVLHGPLHGETYQRQGRNTWILVEKNNGFA